MQTIRQPGELRRLLDAARLEGQSIGLVPTMGSLHEGHLSLCRASAAQNSLTVVSLFVNPLQFGPGEDFERYPRDLEADTRLLGSVGVGVLFAPNREAVYPPGFSTSVEVAGVSEPLEGRIRPGHFRGVATVVLKLFNMTGPCRAYFGEKDYQQLQVIRRMAQDLNTPVEVVPCPVVREPDGLAMSSRNRYLSAEERRAAPAIYAGLREARDRAADGEKEARALEALVQQRLSAQPLFAPDYVAVVDAETMGPVERVERPAVLAVAVRLPSARLIDNIRLG